MTKKAFTLVELMIVIAIIALLAGIMFPVIGMALSSGRNADVQARLAQIQGALVDIEVSDGAYPLVDKVKSTKYFNPNSNKEDLFEANSDLQKRLAAYDQGVFGENGSFVTNTGEKDTDGNDMFCVIDYWEMPIYYQPYTAYMEKDPVVNPDTYQLWSFGEDMENGVGDYAEPYEFSEDNVNMLPFGDDVITW